MASRVLIIGMLIVLCAVIYIVYTTFSLTHQQHLDIPVEDVRSKRFRLVIDVRTPKEREELGYYPNSIPISIDQLKNDVPFLIGSGLQSLQTPILVYSNGDHRAQLAAEMLYSMGYTQVRYIKQSYLSLLPGSQ